MAVVHVKSRHISHQAAANPSFTIGPSPPIRRESRALGWARERLAGLARTKRLARRALAYLWQGPPHLPHQLKLEWRFVAMRWFGIAFVGPGLPLTNLSTEQMQAAYAVLVVAGVWNLAIHFAMPRRPDLFARGWITAVGDSLLNVSMVDAAGGFDSPLYYILYTVTISAAMRYGYGPAIGMALCFVAVDALEHAPAIQPIDGPFVFRSGFLVITAILAGYLTKQAQMAVMLERYVPARLTEELGRRGQGFRAGRVEELTILFADLRDYTQMTERMAPTEAVAFLNRYFAVAVSPLLREGGTIDKYIGDGILAFFEGEGHAERAVRAARAMLVAVENFNSGRESNETVRVGVAIHTGEAMVGTIGTPERSEYTLISDAVNVTVRLEPVNKRFNSGIIISEAAIAVAGIDQWQGFVGPLDVGVRGRREQLRIYYLPSVAGGDASTV